MFYVLIVTIRDEDFEFSEQYHFVATPETFREWAASEFLTAFAPECEYCPGTDCCRHCTEPSSGLEIREQFIQHDFEKPLVISYVDRVFHCRVKQIKPIHIHVLNGYVEYVKNLPDSRWPWEASHERTEETSCTTST
jgi:hypothetical protein